MSKESSKKEKPKGGYTPGSTVRVENAKKPKRNPDSKEYWNWIKNHCYYADT